MAERDQVRTAPGGSLTRFGTLVSKELLRFWKVAHQTVGARNNFV